MEIPVIDLSSAKQDANQLDLVDMACRDHGFFLQKSLMNTDCLLKSWRGLLGE